LLVAYYLLLIIATLQLIHGLAASMRAREARNPAVKKSNKHCEGFSIQATLYPGSFRSSLKRAGWYGQQKKHAYE
jgi:hypothetical protein